MLRSDSEDEAAHAASVDAIVASADARTRAARARGGGRDDGEGARETRDDGEREPVSYTHLTLPTILLV